MVESNIWGSLPENAEEFDTLCAKASAELTVDTLPEFVVLGRRLSVALQIYVLSLLFRQRDKTQYLYDSKEVRAWVAGLNDFIPNPPVVNRADARTAWAQYEEQPND